MRILKHCIAVILLGACGEAGAHAFLDHATPSVGSALERAPEQVSLRFSEPLEAAFSWVKVVDANGRQVDRGDKAVKGGDRTEMSVSLPTLPAGKYRVQWRVLCADTHASEGDFTFEVKP